MPPIPWCRHCGSFWTTIPHISHGRHNVTWRHGLQRFQFVFIPKHGSWLNLVENLFSKMARTMLREIRVGTKQELVDRIHLYFEEVNATPAIFRWKYKMDEVNLTS